MTDAAAARRRSFGPVVLLGLASAGLAAVAGHRSWVAADVVLVPGLATGGGTTAGEVPLAGALALVGLAAWGVLLVTRGTVRRVVAGLALAVALGMAVTAVLGFGSSVDALADELTAMQAQDASVHRTAWVWVYLGAAAGNVVASILAVRLVPSWPEMGNRYDAPGSATAPRDETPLDLWKALDEGRDPTTDE